MHSTGQPKPVRAVFKAPVECPAGMKYVRRNDKIFVYWKLEPTPRYTLTAGAHPKWHIGEHRFRNYVSALSWAAKQLQLIAHKEQKPLTTSD